MIRTRKCLYHTAAYDSRERVCVCEEKKTKNFFFLFFFFIARKFEAPVKQTNNTHTHSYRDSTDASPRCLFCLRCRLCLLQLVRQRPAQNGAGRSSNRCRAAEKMPSDRLPLFPCWFLAALSLVFVACGCLLSPLSLCVCGGWRIKRGKTEKVTNAQRSFDWESALGEASASSARCLSAKPGQGMGE